MVLPLSSFGQQRFYMSHTRKKKRKIDNVLTEHLKKEQTKQLQTHTLEGPIKERINTLTQELEKLPNLPRYSCRKRTLQRQLKEAEKDKKNLYDTKDSYQLMRTIDNMEAKLHAEDQHQDQTMNTFYRLYPPLDNTQTKHLLGSMTSEQKKKWARLRGYKQQYAILMGKPMEVKQNTVDDCKHCGGPMMMDHETSYSICKMCYTGCSFPSYILDVGSRDRETKDSTTQNNVAYTEKFIYQYKCNYPCATIPQLEMAAQQYSKYHMYNRSKVQTNRTQTIAKKYIKEYANNNTVSRFNSECAAEPIPLYTNEQCNTILNQKQQIRDLDHSKYRKKPTYNNVTFIKTFGVANGMQQSQLFKNNKTSHIHMKNVMMLADVCQEFKATQPTSNYSWDLLPCL